MSVKSPCVAARDPKGTTRSQMRTLFEGNNSSISLEGMERPVRSFKSFIKTTPPHPNDTDKSLPSLPLTPAPWDTTNSGRAQDSIVPSAERSKLDRIPSEGSWRAPAEWYDEGASGKSEHLRAPPVSAPRSFAPLIPEPSPGLTEMEAEPTAWITPGTPPINRLLPLYERAAGSPDLGPPGTPPTLPLPATPPTRDRFIENTLPPESRRAHSSPSRRAVDDELRTQALSRADSDASTKEKAFASLGLDSSDFSDRGRKRTDRTYLRRKKLQALNKGSPLADDSWEDEDMDDKTRELSFSQDYHDLLADQYQEMSSQSQEALNSGDPHKEHVTQSGASKSRPLPRDHDLIPRPLSWQKSSGQTTPRSQSLDQDLDETSSSEPKSRHKRLSALLAHHFGALDITKDPTTKPSRRHSKPTHAPTSSPPRAPSDDLRFSKFFPSSRPLKFGNKHKRTPPTKSPPASPPPSQPSPLIRLPGGLAVIRTHSPSPSPARKPTPHREKTPPSPPTRTSSHYESDFSHPTSDHRSSYNSHASHSPATVAPTMRSAYRTSIGSSYSHGSSAGVHRPGMKTGSPPLAPPPPPPPPSAAAASAAVQSVPPVGSPAHSPPRSPGEGASVRGPEKAEGRYTPRFIEKAMEARKRRGKEARQERLKRSIKVLGPTDPGVVQGGYVRGRKGSGEGDSDVEGRVGWFGR